MAIGTEPAASSRSHKAGTPRLARDVVAVNESAVFDIHEDAISAMEALHELELSADATPAQRAAKQRAFHSMSAVARLAAPLETLNTNYLSMKDDTTATRDAMAKVGKAQAERKARQKGQR